ncbi:hypothetical protein J2S73_002849 [Amorphus orientalis]|uniref:Uncharacterized protein n=1 Tax=Amorphus orientalis TaxID=649198 RepID=A0AAE4ATR1_9HYPH|nr:hypothetical protein [Amorphus orientalis]
MAASPAIISFITGRLKKLPAISEMRGSRRPLIRALAAGVSLVYICLTYWVGGGEFDDGLFITTLNTLAVSIIAWLSSLGWYHGFVKRG